MKTVPKPWLPAAGAAAAAGLTLALLTIVELRGPSPPAGLDTPPEPLGQRDGAVHVAGTGTWLPLARYLGYAYGQTHENSRVIVHESIGSSGGLRAIGDSVIDVALITYDLGRPPSPDQCRVIPVAQAAVVFAAHPTVKATSISSNEVVAIYSGEVDSWPEGGPLVPLLREQGDSSTRVARNGIPGFGEAVDEALRLGRWPTLLTDAEMGRALASTPGSVGLFDLGAIALEQTTLRPLALDGVMPSTETLADGSYPLRRVMALVVRQDTPARVGPFIEFIRSAQGLEVIRSSGGYLPLEVATP